MMTFINPIEILDLQAMAVAEIDNATIKKAKRKLFADIDLSDDGVHPYRGQSLSKNECEAVIDGLDNASLIPYYCYLAGQPLLSDLLANGREEYFAQFRQDDIFADPGFIQFFSPYFAERLERSLLRAFLAADAAAIAAMVRTQGLLHATDVDTAFRGLRRELEMRLTTADALTEKIKAADSSFGETEIEPTLTQVKDWFPIAPLNALPTYFQSTLNKIAASINFLQLAIWDRFETPSVPMYMLEHLLQLNMESAKKPTFERNYVLAKEQHVQLENDRRYAAELKPWTDLLAQLKAHHKKIEAKLETADAIAEVLKNTLPVQEINQLPVFGDHVRTQVATAIRSLAIASCNAQDDVVTAIELIDIALQFTVPREVKEGFLKDKEDLAALAKKYRGFLLCYFCEFRKPDEESVLKKTIYKVNSREYRKVNYSYVEVPLPRCKECQNVHAKGRDWMIFLSFGLAFIGIVIGLLTPREHYVIMGGIGLGIGLLGGYLYQQYELKKHNIKGTSHSVLRHHPALAERMSQGWTFNQPSA